MGLSVSQLANCIGYGRLTGQDLSTDELRRRGLAPAEVRLVELLQNLSLMRERPLSEAVEGEVSATAIWNVIVGKNADGTKVEEIASST